MINSSKPFVGKAFFETSSSLLEIRRDKFYEIVFKSVLSM